MAHLSSWDTLKFVVTVVFVPGRERTAAFFSISTAQNGSVHFTENESVVLASGGGTSVCSEFVPDCTWFMGTLGYGLGPCVPGVGVAVFPQLERTMTRVRAINGRSRIKIYKEVIAIYYDFSSICKLFYTDTKGRAFTDFRRNFDIPLIESNYFFHDRKTYASSWIFSTFFHSVKTIPNLF